jgi:hypothetical protein
MVDDVTEHRVRFQYSLMEKKEVGKRERKIKIVTLVSILREMVTWLFL